MTGDRRTAGPAALRRWALAALVLVLRGYQWLISPLLPPSCRFQPNCSEYAVEALCVHGLVRGGALAIWRVLRCGPWHPGGMDPVPPARSGRWGVRSTTPSEESLPC